MSSCVIRSEVAESSPDHIYHSAIINRHVRQDFHRVSRGAGAREYLLHVSFKNNYVVSLRNDAHRLEAIGLDILLDAIEAGQQSSHAVQSIRGQVSHSTLVARYIISPVLRPLAEAERTGSDHHEELVPGPERAGDHPVCQTSASTLARVCSSDSSWPEMARRNSLATVCQVISVHTSRLCSGPRSRTICCRKSIFEVEDGLRVAPKGTHKCVQMAVYASLACVMISLTLNRRDIDGAVRCHSIAIAHLRCVIVIV